MIIPKKYQNASMCIAVMALTLGLLAGCGGGGDGGPEPPVCTGCECTNSCTLTIDQRLDAIIAGEGLRPTSDRIRETLFNWLAPSIHDAHCADLFAGSGALGLEALSRGAALCDFVDCSSAAIRQLALHLDALEASEPAASQGKELLVENLDRARKGKWWCAWQGRSYKVLSETDPQAFPAEGLEALKAESLAEG